MKLEWMPLKQQNKGVLENSAKERDDQIWLSYIASCVYLKYYSKFMEALQKIYPRMGVQKSYYLSMYVYIHHKLAIST